MIKATWENIELTEKAHSVNSDLETWKTCGWLPEQLVEHSLARITQPVFIDGAEYLLKDSSGHGDATLVRYSLGTNSFYEVGKPFGFSAPISDFGKHFTVELVTVGQPPQAPKPSASLYNRIVKVLGERDVPIGGEDHLVGQVKVDSHKAKILDKVVEEFNIPVGGNIIQWLRNRTQNQSTVNRTTPRNKYDREILPGVHVDVYDVLEAFNPQSKAIDHAVKKLLCPGQRGVKDRITDLEEAMSSICREIERLGEWSEGSDRATGEWGDK